MQPHVIAKSQNFYKYGGLGTLYQFFTLFRLLHWLAPDILDS